MRKNIPLLCIPCAAVIAEPNPGQPTTRAPPDRPRPADSRSQLRQIANKHEQTPSRCWHPDTVLVNLPELRTRRRSHAWDLPELRTGAIERQESTDLAQRGKLQVASTHAYRMDARHTNQSQVATRRQLLARGFTPRSLAQAVHVGRLVRVRRGYYAHPDVDDLTQQAVRVGGVLTCVSAARHFGMWVVTEPVAHIHLRHEASRMRAPHDQLTRLTESNRGGNVLHWFPLVAGEPLSMHSVGPLSALAHLIRCQPERLAIAAIDSALYEGIVREPQLDAVFAAVPLKFGSYRQRADARAMSGLETIVRLLLLDSGMSCSPQVHFRGIGDVDLVVEGRIVVETDGRRGHADTAGAARDYDRDVALAALGLIVLRFNYRQVIFSPDVVLRAVRGALAAPGRMWGIELSKPRS